MIVNIVYKVYLITLRMERLMMAIPRDLKELNKKISSRFYGNKVR